MDAGMAQPPGMVRAEIPLKPSGAQSPIRRPDASIARFNRGSG